MITETNENGVKLGRKSLQKSRSRQKNCLKPLIRLETNCRKAHIIKAKQRSLDRSLSHSTRITLLNEIRATLSSERWDEFFVEYRQLLQKWLISKQIEPADAEDVCQETMVAVINDLPKFEHNGRTGAFRLWLKRILMNRIRRVVQKRISRKEVHNLARLVETLADEETELSMDLRKEHDQFVLGQLLSKAESQFPVERVQLFKELVIEELPIEELSARYDMTTGAIRVQQHRILKWLKEFGSGMIEI